MKKLSDIGLVPMKGMRGNIVSYSRRASCLNRLACSSPSHETTHAFTYPSDLSKFLIN
jgi:hypothetical protein